MTLATVDRVAVFGGNGFLGQAICRALVCAGMDVISISRSGKKPTGFPFAKKVDWRVGNAITQSPEDLAGLLKGCDAVVNTIGSLQAGEGYKRMLGKGSGYEGKPEDLTLEKMNYQSAVNIIEACALVSDDVLRHVFISAAGKAPGIARDEYITTKRRAEKEILKYERPSSLILRPGFMYSEGDLKLAAVGGILKCAQAGGRFLPGAAAATVSKLGGLLMNSEETSNKGVAAEEETKTMYEIEPLSINVVAHVVATALHDDALHIVDEDLQRDRIWGPKEILRVYENELKGDDGRQSRNMKN
eukprot:Nk52_evm26s355 gene=Nk52_evmTU26s355